MIKSLLKKYNKLSMPVKCALMFTICNFLQRGINVIVVPIFTRIMTTQQYGMYNVYTAWSGVLVIFSTLYLHMGVIDKALLQCNNKSEKRKVVAAFQGLSAVIAFLFFVLYLFFRKEVNHIIGLPDLVTFFMFLSFIFLEPLNLWIVYKRYSFEYKEPIFIITLSAILVPVIGIISMKFTCYKGEARILSYLGVTILIGAIMYIRNLKQYPVIFDKKLWIYAFSFNIVLIPHFLSEIVLNQVDRIMIDQLVGTSEAAIYSIAYSAAQLILMFTQALNMSFAPWQYQKIKGKEYKELQKLSNSVLVLVAFLLVILITFAPEAIYLLAGKKYSDATSLVPSIALGIFFSFVYQYFTRVELYYEKKKCMVMASVAAAALNIILNWYFIKLYGYKAAGYTTLICYMFLCILHFIFYKKICREQNDGNDFFDIRTILLISTVMLMMGFFMMFIYEYFLLRYALLTVFLVVLLKNKNKMIQVIKQMKDM